MLKNTMLVTILFTMCASAMHDIPEYQIFLRFSGHGNLDKSIWLRGDFSWDEIREKIERIYKDVTNDPDIRILVNDRQIDFNNHSTSYQEHVKSRIFEHQTIVFLPKLRGGSGCQFYDYENTNDKNTQLLDWGKDAPDWLRAVAGANLEGVCENSGCVAYNERVISGLGYGQFYVIRNSEFVAECKCPMCKTSIIPRTTSFNNCFFQIVGRKSDNNMKWESPWKKIGDKYLRHDETDNKALWSGLRIECRELYNPPEHNDDI